MFSNLPSVGTLFFVLSFIVSVFLTALGVALKLCGVLLLSWWWVACPIPVVIVAGIFIAGLMSLFDY